VSGKKCWFAAAIPNVANNLNRKGHTGRKESLVWLLLCRGFAFYALCVVEAALHLELLVSRRAGKTRRKRYDEGSGQDGRLQA
jgi:hypothetical protein